MNFWSKINTPLTILSPMEGVTDVVFREIISEIAKPDVLFTEFTNVDAVLIDNKFTKRSLLFTKNQHPIVAQIWGLDPQKFMEASHKIAKLGFDGIDINLGCPVHAVVKKGACSAMIGNNKIVSEIISAVKSAGLPTSVKTRLGFDKIITEEWFSFLLDQNLAAIIIHGRTAVQKSNGDVNWDEIGKVVQMRNKSRSKTKIVGNGNIKNYSQILEMHNKYGVDGVMIGRGIFENPWIFDRNQTIHSAKEHFDLFTKHLNLFEKFYGNSVPFDVLKKFLKAYLRSFSGSKNLRLNLMSAKSIKEARYIIRDYQTRQL